MKQIYTLKWIILMLLLCGASSCTQEDIDFRNPDVKLFVKQLKSGTYNAKDGNGVVAVPMFTTKHVPELLKYAEDMTEIPSFPLLSISSQYGGKPRLGECMLWIIEGIRLGYVPSLGCKLVKRDAQDYEGIYFLSNEEAIQAAAFYRQWWETIENPTDIPPALMWSVDPLSNSNYRWW